MSIRDELKIVVHGGVGTPADRSDGCALAIERVLQAVEDGQSLLDAVCRGAVLMEDDPRYNAGTGSSYRLDGQTIEMDAGLMDQSGRIGGVAAIRDVRNPILVAREVVDIPHALLAGEAALRFARARGFEHHDPGTPAARKKFEDIRAKLAQGDLPEGRQDWLEMDLKQFWNFDTPYESLHASGTIGVVATLGDQFATACSTGGASPMLAGRVGDSPLPGAGFWAGPLAAVGATGIGEEIIRQLLSKWVYDRIEAGLPVQQACEQAVARFPESVPMGMIAVSATEWGSANNEDMAWAAWHAGEMRTAG